MTKETSTINIEFKDLWSMELFQAYLNEVPKESFKKTLTAFYSLKLSEYINTCNYEAIAKLEGIMELHNIVDNI